MYHRSIEPALKRFETLFPVLGITGPRQSGKTTIAQRLFPHLPYVSLENLDERLRAKSDPRAFLETYLDGAIFDEIQHVPDLLSYLQGIVDASKNRGRFIVTGSQNFVLSEQIAQSLSGRIGMTSLLPLSLEELGKRACDASSATRGIFMGGYPGLHSHTMKPHEFFPSYIQTYIERDVRQIKNIENFAKFQTFLKLCAGRVGQLINFSSLAQDCGISHTTARQWLGILEASYIVFLLPPFHKNFNKRLVKTPKLYFYDTGLACSLLGLENESQLSTHYLRGSLFENLSILEIFKARLNQGLPPNLYFWRDKTGHEVNVVGEWGGTLHAFEIKSGSTFQKNHIRGVLFFCGLAEQTNGYLIYPGHQEGSHQNIQLVPLHKLGNNAKK